MLTVSMGMVIISESIKITYIDKESTGYLVKINTIWDMKIRPKNPQGIIIYNNMHNVPIDKI